jgi:hypothetical protein
MKKKKTLVIVEWADAWNAARWTSDESANALHEPYMVYTVGWLFRSDKIGVSVMDSYSENDDPGGQHFIPRGMIRKIRKVKY